MKTRVATLSVRRARTRTWTRDGSTGTERMSDALGTCSGRAPSPEPTRGFVATEWPLYGLLRRRRIRSDPLGATSEQRERSDEHGAPAHVEQVVVVEVGVHVA